MIFIWTERWNGNRLPVRMSLLWRLVVGAALLSLPVHTQLTDRRPPPWDVRPSPPLLPNDFPPPIHNNLLEYRPDPTYMVLASQVIRPGSVYRVVVTLLQNTLAISDNDVPATETDVTASVAKDGMEISSARASVDPGHTQLLLLKIPQTSTGNFTLRVEGINNEIASGGRSFIHTSNLKFAQRFLTVIIHTNRPIYREDQDVKVRAILLDMEMKPYSEPVNINILDPNRHIMAHYRSVQLNVGVAEVKFTIPQLFVVGFWRVQVIAKGQTEEKEFLVEKHYFPRLEIFVFMPEFVVLDSDETITGMVEGTYTSDGHGWGNATLRLYELPPSIPIPSTTYDAHNEWKRGKLLIEEEVPIFRDSYDYEFSMEEIRSRANLVPGSRLKLEAHVYDKVFDMYNYGFGSTLIIDGKVTLRFLGHTRKVFKPGMMFRTYLAVSYSDSAPLSEEKREKGRLIVRPVITTGRGSNLAREVIDEPIPDNGILKIEVDLPGDARLLIIKARYVDTDGETAETELKAVAFSGGPRNRTLQIMPQTSTANIDEFVILRVRANFYMSSFTYVVTSKGVIVHAGSEPLDALRYPIKSLSIAVSSEMAPSFRVLVYHVTNDGFIISDSVTIPINSLNRHKINLNILPHKDKSGDTLEFGVNHIPGVYFGLFVIDDLTFCRKCGAEFTPATALEDIHSFDSEAQHETQVKWFIRDPEEPDQVSYWDSSNPALDSEDTFLRADIIVHSDARFSFLADSCNETEGAQSCKDGGCFPAHKRCDGVPDCRSEYDEIGCPRKRATSILQGSTEQLTRFRILRRNRIDQCYDLDIGDWLWVDFNTDYIRDYQTVEVPNRESGWYIGAYGMDHKLGLGVLDNYIRYVGTRPVFFVAEMPSQCRFGEQVSVRMDVFNMLEVGVEVIIVLAHSEDYKFVHVGKEGFVKSYDPETTYGSHQHLVWMEPESEKIVYLPIVATRLGEIEVTVESWSHVAKISQTLTFTVEPDGFGISLHTSLLMDLTTQPTVIRYLNVNVTESPIIPYEQHRYYLFGSARAHVSLVGDAFGAVYHESPTLSQTLIQKPDRTAEAMLFSYGANLWTLHYLRLTNQLTKAIRSEAFPHIRYYYASTCSFRNVDGSFSMWRDQEPSVWLTAAVIRLFQHGRFSDWENDLYIDVDLLTSAVRWIVKHQTPKGSFIETMKYPPNSRMQSINRRDKDRYQNIPLTAFVLIALEEVVSDLPGEARIPASTAKVVATRFLEKQVQSIVDPYEMAIVAYALTLVGSVDASIAFHALDKMKLEQEGKIYWARVPRPLTEYFFENQRPFIQAHRPTIDDALAVEATAYALLVYIAHEGVLQEGIVKWLNTVRSTDGGFFSTQDSIVAMQALAEYSFRARNRDITDMMVNVQISSSPGFDETVGINGGNLAEKQVVELPNVWGHVDVIARGAGLGVLQLHLTYSVDRIRLAIPPAQRAFDLNVDLRYHGRNASIMVVHACQRWVLQRESPVSGLAVFEMDLPTGYYQFKPALYSLVESKRISNLRRMFIDEKKVYAFFDHLTLDYTCINFEVQRWWPVANLSQYLKAKVYEYHAPERYNESLLNMQTLYVLDICSVCGSYQCPYCPYYSASPPFYASSPVTLTLIASIVTILSTYDMFFVMKLLAFRLPT